MSASLRHLPALVLLSMLCPVLRADLPSADRALQEGRVADVQVDLRPWLAQHPSDPDAHLLLCRAFYSQGMAGPAVGECEAAAAGDPASSETQLWLGRAYGMKASAASALSAFSLARRVRDAFERSTRLDPANFSAWSDLGEYYVEAPSIVGGGSSKARRLAAHLQALNQPQAKSQGHRILALLAEKSNDQATAEAEFRLATAGGVSSDWNSAAWIDLGAFYARRHQPDQAVAAVRSGIAAGTTRGATLVDAASILTAAGREPDLARQLLREYIDSPARSDAAPVFKVHLQLGDLLARSGDLTSAHREYAAALALAPDFPPARSLALATPPSAIR